MFENDWASLVAQLVKNLPAMQETQVWSLAWKDPLEKGMVTHSSILAWRIPRIVKSMGSQRVWYSWATKQQQQKQGFTLRPVITGGHALFGLLISSFPNTICFPHCIFLTPLPKISWSYIHEFIPRLSILFHLSMCVSHSVVSNFVTPWTVAHQDTLSMEFSRQECWSELPVLSPHSTIERQ